ncbi:MAG: hypothetical protein QXF52_02530 [Thermoproteota archaeon]
MILKNIRNERGIKTIRRPIKLGFKIEVQGNLSYVEGPYYSLKYMVIYFHTRFKKNIGPKKDWKKENNDMVTSKNGVCQSNYWRQ